MMYELCVRSIWAGTHNSNLFVSLEVKASHCVCRLTLEITARTPFYKGEVSNIKFTCRNWKTPILQTDTLSERESGWFMAQHHFHCDSSCHLTARGNPDRFGLTRSKPFHLMTALFLNTPLQHSHYDIGCTLFVKCLTQVQIEHLGEFFKLYQTSPVGSCSVFQK